jgi:hypothetical protein
MDDRKSRYFDVVSLVDDLGLAEIKLGGHYLLAVRIYSSLVGGVVPGQRFLDGSAEVLGAQAGFGQLLIELTPKGKELLEDIDKENLEITRKMLKGLSDEEIETFKKILLKISENI